MASESSSHMTTIVLTPASEKLGCNNHTTWHAPVLATLCGARLEGFIIDKKTPPPAEIAKKDGEKVSNPDYEDWHAGDQQVFGYILASISKEILVHIATAKTVIEAWNILEEQFTSQTRASAISTHMELANTHKGTMTMVEYLSKMLDLGNDMASAGKPLDDEDLVQYILSGLDEDYDSMVNSVLARATPISVSELATQMLFFETHIILCNGNGGSGSSANFARRGGFGHGGPSRGSDRGRSGRGGRSSTPGCSDHAMNACGRGNNTMEIVYSARSASSMGTRQIVAGIGLKKITSPSLDTVQLLPPLLTRWIPTDMPTQELLTISLVSWTNLPCVTSIMSERRCTQSTVRVWRLVMLVSLLFTPHLENLNYLTFFMSHKQQKISCVFIISLWIIMSFFEIHPWFFFIKDQDTRNTLLRGRC
jgi:hypothetical protein